MTIYTLYKKTHQTTGLKYLGYTKQDPYVYKGSGKYWTSHIELHGYSVDTEILFQTEHKKDIKPIGIYYSNLWNVVESKDWANLKPEEGEGGGGMFGELNPSKRLVVRKKISDKLKGVPKSEKHKANIYNPMLDPTISSKTKGKNHVKYDHTVYCWEHKDTKEQLFLTQYDFRQRFGFSSGYISNVVAGRASSAKGYILIKTP
jgi:hypothetical protein